MSSVCLTNPAGRTHPEGRPTPLPNTPKPSREQFAPEEAIARLGFTDEPGYRTRLDVAVAHIVLENVEERLPQWAAFVGEEFVHTRQYRDVTERPDRRILLQPRLLFEINWADSGPGFSWPVAYYVTWLPYCDRFVVTASADSPGALGYCDFALGSFGIETPIKEGSCAITRADWQAQHGGGSVAVGEPIPHWAHLGGGTESSGRRGGAANKMTAEDAA